jgi:hypothetical protein
MSAKSPRMENLGSALFLLVLLCASAGVGFFVNGRLPEKHRSRDSIEVVQLAIGLLVTFTAIVLGLLTTSVKSGFDAALAARGAYASQFTQMDRCLRDYGPETQPIRKQLRSYVAAVIASTWPSEPPPADVSYPDMSGMPLVGEKPVLADIMNAVGNEMYSLEPADALHRNLMSACMQQYADLIKSRWTIIEGVHRSISMPFYWVLVFWLVILFACFGLRAPPNSMNVTVIGLSALSIALAMFIILDMDVPYRSLFGI